MNYQQSTKSIKHINNLWRSTMTSISSNKPLANINDEGMIKECGISGTEFIISTWAKSRYKNKVIKEAKLNMVNDGVTISFHGSKKEPLYQGQSHFLCHSLDITKAQVFKNEKEATTLLKALDFSDNDIVT